MDFAELRTVEPGSGTEDLKPVLDMIGDARVVGLGECAYGSRESLQMKHRLVELLVEELSFSTIVLEANLAEVIRVNEYVLEGRGDLTDVLPRRLYPGVSTEEFAALLRYMWAFNTSGRHRISLAGCGMQRIDAAAEIVKEELARLDPDLEASVAERYAKVLEADRMHWLSGKGVQAWFPVEEARGRRIRFSGFIRTENVDDHACIWGWAGGSGGTITHDALEGRRPRGTTDWREYAINLDVPERAHHISIGCYLAGNGTAWFEGLRVEIDGEPWRDPERIDLELSSGELQGFWVDPRNLAALDLEVTRTGRPSLRIEPAEEFPAFDTGGVEALALAKQVLAELESRFHADEASRVHRCARSVVQTLAMRTGGGDAARARLKAENVEWLLNRDQKTRLIFWAHNGNVSRGGGDTGSFLAKSLGKDYVPVGFATGTGLGLTMSRRRREGPREHPLESPPEGSIEARLLEIGRPRLVADLRTVSPNDPEWGWLDGRLPFRHVGPSALPLGFHDERVGDEFDLLAWLAESTAAQPLAR